MDQPAVAAALPLQGVRVLELSQFLSAPACGVMLADLGADVFKIEKFPAGDDQRGWRKPGDSGLAPNFVMVNRGKRSVALDIRSPEGKAALLRMADAADVVLENFRPGVLERQGLGYEALRQRNPRLVHCSITGYGPVGPLASEGGFDLILQAFSGLISLTGEPGRKPVKPGVSLADVNAGILAAFGILAAYVQRLRTGAGQRVDTSLLHASMQQMYWAAAAYFATGAVTQPTGTAAGGVAPYQVFECADGGIAIGGVNDANWARITEVLGHPEWQRDERFLTARARGANRHALEKLVEQELGRHAVQHWSRCFSAAGVPASPVHDVAQALEHAQTRAIGMVTEVAAPQGGTVRTLGSPVMFDGRSRIAPMAAPRLGEHTRESLAAFGFGAAEIDTLLDSGAAHQAPQKTDENAGAQRAQQPSA
jgi:crotonobetainyl-CoA:carnitine CoA-transferase CaiB-like acyl-CoA transferase